MIDDVSTIYSSLARGLRGDQKRARETLVPPAFAVLWQVIRFIVLYGGRSAAKSWSIARVLLVMGHDQPLRVLCCREIQGSIRESAYRLLCDQIHALELDDFYEIQADRIIGRNGSCFFFEGLRFNASKIRSYEGFDVVWVEEGQNVSDLSLETLLPTIRKAGSRFFISFNPMTRDDPVLRRFVEGRRTDVLAKKVSWRDNPYLSSEALAEKDWLERTDPDAYRHVWEGEPRTVSDALILRGKYSVEEFEVSPGWAGPYHGLDYGFSRDPTAALRCFVDDDTRTLYITHEFWQLGCDIDALYIALEGAIAGIGRHVVYADSARPESTSYLARNGIPSVRSAEKWPGSVDDGIAYLRAFARIVIHPRCKHFLDECNTYSFKTDRLTGVPLPEPEDKNNHCLAEGTLIVTARGEVPVERVTCDDQVLTRAGMRRVLWSGVSGRNRQVYRVRTGRGLILDATGDHEIFTTNRGFTRVDALGPGDGLLTWLGLRQLNIGDSFGGVIQMPQHTPTVPTSAGLLYASARAKPIYIARSGLMLTGLYRRAITSIILTAIKVTTPWLTWSVFPHPNTWPSMATTCPRSMPSGGASAWQRFDRLLGSGIRVMRATLGMLRTGMSGGRVCAMSATRSASAAVRRSALMHWARTRNSAPTPARQRHVGSREWMTSTISVVSAAQRSGQTSMRVVSPAVDYVTRVTEHGVAARVYDLTIDTQHEFFANGILVHNCIDALRYALSPLIRNQPTGGYFTRSALLMNGEPVEPPQRAGRPHRVYITVAMTERTGTGIGAITWLHSPRHGMPLVLLDYDLIEIDQLGGEWLRGLYARAQELRAQWDALEPITTLWCEEGAGQLYEALELVLTEELLPADPAFRTGARPLYDLGRVQSRRLLNAQNCPLVSLDERAADLRTEVNSGRLVKFARSAYTRQLTHRTDTAHHLAAQLFGYRPRVADAAQELCAAFTLGCLVTRGGDGRTPLGAPAAQQEEPEVVGCPPPATPVPTMWQTATGVWLPFPPPSGFRGATA
jgi:phage terminase large subunit